MLELTRIVLFLAALAGAACSVALDIERLALHPWLRVAAYTVPIVVVLIVIVAGLRGPRFVIPPKMPFVFKAFVVIAVLHAALRWALHLRVAGTAGVSLAAASESASGRHAVMAALLAGYVVALSIAWRRVPPRQARM